MHAERRGRMILLLIIADDFTGALDTGVQFAAHGISTRVVVDPEVNFSAHDVKVLVVDTETRHLSPKEAYSIVTALTVRAKQADIRYIYKKTDSALRGNIGAELAALLTASGHKQLPFLPAFPQTGRITCQGIHYVDGVPVTESPFGADPFEPVKHSVVTELIKEQCSFPTHSYPALSETDPVPQDDGILVFDAADDQELFCTGRRLLEQNGLSIMAGCAGFGAVLPKLLEITADNPMPLPIFDPRLLVVCGSVNPITLSQLDRAEQSGFSRLRLTLQQKLQPGYWQSEKGKTELKQIESMLANNPHCIIESSDSDFNDNQPTADYAKKMGIDRETLRVRIASSLGYLVGELFTCPSLGTLLLTGGDTLLQCMSCVGVQELEPICELEKGVVLASFTYNGCTHHVITKSGGFGQENLLTNLADRLASRQL